MKTIVAAGLAALFIVVAAVAWGPSRPSAAQGPASASQIYIHGTPVCVFRDGDAIVARIGVCGSGGDEAEGMPGRRAPDDGSGMSLPPGHPPVGPDALPDDGPRRIPI